MRPKSLRIFASITAALWPLAWLVKTFWRDLVGAPGTVSDLAEWRDHWWPEMIEHVGTVLAGHPAVWALSGLAAALLVVLSWPEIKMLLNACRLTRGKKEEAAADVTEKQPEVGGRADRKPAALVKVEYYFNNDFKTLLKLRTSVMLQTKGKSDSFKVPMIIHLDRDANACFVAFYFSNPLVDTKFFYSLARECNTLVNQRKNGLDVTLILPTDASRSSFGRMVFTGRVYLYFEGSIDVVELGRLTEFYSKAGLELHFRGPQYAYAEWMRNITKS